MRTQCCMIFCQINNDVEFSDGSVPIERAIMSSQGDTEPELYDS